MTYKRELKSFCLEMRDGHHGGHFENIFASSPEPKGQVTGKLLGSIGMTCRSKIAIIPIRNPRCCHLENLLFASTPEPKGQLTRNLVGSMG